MISENVGNIKQVQALINEFDFDKLFLGGRSCMREKSLLNKNAIIILTCSIKGQQKILHSDVA